MSTDRIVVAGGLGFVGRALIADLKSQGNTNIRSVSRNINPLTPWQKFHEPHIETRDGVEYMSADLSDERQALGALRDARYVYNLAASVGGIDFIQANRTTCMLSAQIDINILKACQKVGVSKLFYASSACVYPSNSAACAESYAEPFCGERGYGWAKMFGEQLCREFRDSGNVETRVARYFTLYGGDTKKHPHFADSLCKKLATAKILAHKSIELWGDGSQVRSLLYIDDCVIGTRKIMDSGVTRPINLSSPEFATVNQMVDLVQKEIAGTDLQVNYVEGATGVQSRYSDNGRIRHELNWEPPTSLREGLEKTWRFWYDRQLKELRGTPESATIKL